jgi:hypothetical protein
MRTAAHIIRSIAHQLITLRRPVTAAAATTTLIGLVAPFGLDLTHQATQVAAGLTIVGLIAAVIEQSKV